MKAVISNRIYLQCTASMKQSIDKELTYLIPSHNPADPPQVISNMAVIREDLISIPIGRIDLIPKNLISPDPKNLI